MRYRLHGLALMLLAVVSTADANDPLSMPNLEAPVCRFEIIRGRPIIETRSTMHVYRGGWSSRKAVGCLGRAAFRTADGVEFFMRDGTVVSAPASGGVARPVPGAPSGLRDVVFRRTWPMFSFQGSRYFGDIRAYALDEDGVVHQLRLSESGVVLASAERWRLPAHWKPVALALGDKHDPVVLAIRQGQYRILRPGYPSSGTE